MAEETPGKLLRIYVGESDQWHHRPLYETIVMKAREMGLAGATVLRGPMGFGESQHLHTAKILRLSTDLPVVIEVADRSDRILQFVATLKGMVVQATATLQDVTLIRFSADSPPSEASRG